MGIVDLLARIGKRPEGLLEQSLSDDRRRVRTAARGIDRVDMVLGPLSALAYLSGDDGLQTAAIVTNSAELIGLKLPYMQAYYKETKDLLMVAAWSAKEALMNGWPGFAFGDLFPVYSNGTRNRLEKDYLKEKKENGYSRLS